MKNLTNKIQDMMVQSVLEAEGKGQYVFDNVPSGVSAILASAVFGHLKSNTSQFLLLITTNNTIARSLVTEIEGMIAESEVVFLPAYESIPYDYSGLSKDIAIERIKALHEISYQKKPQLIVCPVASLIRKLPDRQYLLSLEFSLQLGQKIDPQKLLDKLIRSGYQRKPQVENPCECSLRGDILDIFISTRSFPVRIEFFDDEIEKIREFESDSQLSFRDVDEIDIFPSGEFLLQDEDCHALSDFMKKPDMRLPHWYTEGCLDEKNIALNQYDHNGLQELFAYVHPLVDFLDYFDTQPHLLFLDPPTIYQTANRIEYEYRRIYKEACQNHLCPPVDDLIDCFQNKLTQPEKFTRHPLYIFFQPRFNKDLPPGFVRDENDAGEASLKKSESTSGSLETDKDAFDPFSHLESVSNPFGCRELEGYTGKVSEVRNKLLEAVQNGTNVVIASPFESQVMRISRMFSSYRDIEQKIILADPSKEQPQKVKKSKQKAGQAVLTILQSPVSSGFSFEDEGLLLLTDTELFGKSYRRKSKFKSLSSAPIVSFLDLKEGDFVVHVNHGVGKFVKLEKVQAAGRERDFLIIEYAGADRLYVPLDQISLVQRYIAPVEKPRLDNLGKNSFKKVRERVEQKIEEFAEDLIKLYALRMSKRGYQFPPDTNWQEEFEAEFPYDETPDQLLAIDAVKSDMESPRPMDRLICGDVGFGKTEVAIRAAFKAALAGRQVALIAPTTILAMQHFNNLSNRFADYPISVDWISRFRSASQIKEIKGKLLRGELDVIIGTHALFSNSIHIKNLGLLIVDEEQRFGVKHKEAIKRMRKLVDVMTLSATPIPRTLHMSMIGVRDLSIIQTPPSQRRPVQTYVLEDNDTFIRQAIQRELERGGQVFYLHNRVQTIDNLALRLQQLLPEVTIGVLHGQLPEDEIEDTLLRFVQKQFDILVTTTIIENGIDMPNVNTLIVDRADIFGLSQLYQIRGRVGRADKQAFAYFLYNPGRALTETGAKRLNTILEYQELGSGFKVAMRDLEIRGAGNLLGMEQSGQIAEVGYEMYINLLENAVKRLKGEDTMADLRCALNLKTDFYIPDNYIQDTKQRISFYKRFEAALNESEINALEKEMQDRYGRMPAVAQTFCDVERIRAMSSQTGFEKVYELESGVIELVAGNQIRVDVVHLVSCIQTIKGLSMKPGNNSVLRWQPIDSANKLKDFCEVLRAIVLPLNQKAKLDQSEKSRDLSRRGAGIAYGNT